MREFLSLSRRTRLTNRRGAALLLAIYFASLMLLILGGISLQRTVTEARAAQTSRDANQSYWLADAGFEQVLTTIRSSTLPTFNQSVDSVTNLGCAYGTAINDTSLNVRSNYMICQTSNPTQYQVELVGTSPTGRPTWVSAFVERKVPQAQLSQAIVGLDGITVSLGRLGGMNSALSATDPNKVKLDFDKLSKEGLPGLLGMFNNRGNLATKATLTGALKILNMSAVYGNVLTSSPQVQQVSSDSTNVETGSGIAPVALTSFPPVQVPTTSVADLGPTLYPIIPAANLALSGSNVKLTNAWVSLTPGTYSVNNLTVKDSLFATSGPVDLFVTGSLSLLHSLVYGQPTGAALKEFNFLPPNLRIFVTPADAGDTVRIRDRSLLAGILYAPAMDVRVDRRSILLGALVSKTAQVGILPWDSPSWFAYMQSQPGAYDGQVFYDQAVGSVPISPSPDKPQANVLVYTIHNSISEASQLTKAQQDRIINWFQFAKVSAPGFVSAASPVLPSSYYGGGGYGGGCGGVGGGGSVICTELHRQRYLSDAWFTADVAYVKAHVDYETWIGYYTWARYVAAGMRHSAFMTSLIRPLGLAWAQHMAFVMGASKEDNTLGRVINDVGIPLNRAFGKYLTLPPFIGSPAARVVEWWVLNRLGLVGELCQGVRSQASCAYDRRCSPTARASS